MKAVRYVGTFWRIQLKNLKADDSCYKEVGRVYSLSFVLLTHRTHLLEL